MESDHNIFRSPCLSYMFALVVCCLSDCMGYILQLYTITVGLNVCLPCTVNDIFS